MSIKKTIIISSMLTVLCVLTHNWQEDSPFSQLRIEVNGAILPSVVKPVLIISSHLERLMFLHSSSVSIQLFTPGGRKFSFSVANVILFGWLFIILLLSPQRA